MRFFGLGRPLLRYLERLASHDLALRVLGSVRVRTYERLEPLSPVQLDRRREGDVLSRLVADVDALQAVHLRGFGPPLVALVAGAVSVAVAAVLLPEAGLALAAGLLVAGVAAPLVAALLAGRRVRREAADRGELTAELVELLGAAPELVVYGQEDARLDRLRAANRALVVGARRGAFASGAGEAVRLSVAGLTVAGVLGLAVDAHAAGRLPEVLIAVLALLALASFEAVQPLPAAARELAATLGAGRRVLELTQQVPSVRDPANPAELPAGPPALAFEGVRARYRDDEPLVLDGLSFRLEPGRRIALLGPSGAGKTTVANLMLRFLDPEAGRVTLAGRDLREYRQEDVRRAIAVAGQDAHVFSTSIRANVVLARPGSTDAEVEEALRQAQLWRFASSLPDGIDTPVGERGRELSGGQRQRLVLARALLAGAPVLVLDEPTAHLDEATAEALVADILAAAGERSVLLITHRPEGLELVDEVVVLPGAAG